MGSFALGLLVGAVAGPVVIFAALAWYVRRRVKNEAYEPPWVPTGDAVPLDWEVQALGGQAINLGELVAGRVAFLNFWATWCPPCVGEAPGIDRLYERFKDRVAFVCLSREGAGTIARFQRKTGHRFPMYHLAGEPPEEFRAQGIPATFILSRGRRVVLRHVGAADWGHESVVRFLEGLLEGGGEAPGREGPRSSEPAAGGGGDQPAVWAP
jgi:thiol-disulfide isomerase/thioredoxin